MSLPNSCNQIVKPGSNICAPKANIKGACAILQAGGIILYSTETYCAIGALINNETANAAILRIKGRPQGKPLPVIAGSFAQAAAHADMTAAPAALFTTFWPGPLSIILPALQNVAPQVMDSHGNICIRISASPSATLLARLAGMPISASSANFSGQMPQTDPNSLDCNFINACLAFGLPFAIFSPDESENPAEINNSFEANDILAGTSHYVCKNVIAPSTIVKPVPHANGFHLELLREGAISASLLAAWENNMKKNLICPHCGKPYSAYRNPTPTTDVIIYDSTKGVVIIKRRNEPHGYAIPGGFIDEGEQAEAAAVREMKEETGLDVELTGLLGVYSSPHRDPRQHTLSVVFVGKAKNTDALKAGDDAATAAFYPPEKLPQPIAFDHARIMADFCEYLAGKRSLAPVEQLQQS